MCRLAVDSIHLRVLPREAFSPGGCTDQQAEEEGSESVFHVNWD
ncbi:hypothetical protein EVA_07015 [gut metagenome]|uniref:Uncharacterized protein n=1 Tax=gut metagenome TaxID=749906 RepID=J9GD99_9ZZZZ